MRIRTIKPEFWQSEEVSELSPEAALLAIGLLNYSDDEGFFRFNPKLIEATVFPLRKLSVSIHALLTELSNMGYIKEHEGSDGRRYGHIVNFLIHQRINRPSPSKIAEILYGSKENEDSVNTHGGFTEDSREERKGTGKGKEQGTGNRERKESQTAKPLCTLDQAISYAPSIGMTQPHAEHWWHTRNASGWTKGSSGGGSPRKITSFQSDMATSKSWVAESLSKSTGSKQQSNDRIKNGFGV